MKKGSKKKQDKTAQALIGGVERIFILQIMNLYD